MAQFRKDTHSYLKDGTTIFEVVMLADQYGNLVGPSNPTGMAIDAFGRARSSQPYTLLDSSYRYRDNSKHNTANTATGTYSFNSNTASIDCSLDTTSGAYVYRESTRVFAYQPGKSLQILKSFVMNSAKANLRQRVGYFSTTNGFFLERAGASTVQFVERSTSSGVTVDTPVLQSNWSIDPLDGTGPSKLTLNLNDPQILFIDVEWLGVGTVRMGFVINGQFIHCHSFNHANIDTSIKGAYIQTACLPVRSEIENTGATASASTLKMICSTVISEGGYQLAGISKTIGNDPTAASQFTLTTAGTYYPVLSVRLNPSFIDSIVIPTNLGIMPINAANYRYKVINGATINGATWANVSTNSSIQYNTNTSATITGGTELVSDYITSTVQGGGAVSIGGPDLFRFQLERNTFTSTPSTLTIAITSGTATSNVCASLAWEEIV